MRSPIKDFSHTHNSENVTIKVGEQDNNVMMTFDKSISWLQTSAESAIELGEMLKEKGIEILRSQPQ